MAIGVRINRHICLVFAGLIALSFPQQAHSDTTLTFCYDPYPPYTFGTEGAPSGGLKVALLEAVVDQIDGVSARVVLLPWKRCQAQVKAGEIDGILPLFRNPERESYMAFTEGTFNETSQFWYNRASFPDGKEWDGDYASISHLTLGMLIGSYIDREMEDAFSAHQDIVRARDVQSLMRLLLAGRVDLVATDSAVGRFEVSTHGWQDQISPVTRHIISQKSRFGLSITTGANRFIAPFNTAIRRLERQGRIEEILRSQNYPEGE